VKILIIEDESKLAEMLRKGLKEEGFAVERAKDGPTGVEMILSGTFDAVILDILLPGFDGFDVLQKIREASCIVPVLVLSALSSLDERVKGLDAGADDYLAKPFAFKELLARLRAISRRPAAEPQRVLVAADLEMDLTRHEVRRDGELIVLSAREFALLEYLLKRKDFVLTRAMILDQVWASDYDYDGGSNVVDVYINSLRKKVDTGHGIKLIHTIRSSGYVLRERS
jgi:DNA-binding response OmpR family regulator